MLTYSVHLTLTPHNLCLSSRSSFASVVLVLLHALHFTLNMAVSIGSSSPQRLIRLATGSGARCPHWHFAIHTLPREVSRRFLSRECRSLIG